MWARWTPAPSLSIDTNRRSAYAPPAGAAGLGGADGGGGGAGGGGSGAGGERGPSVTTWLNGSRPAAMTPARSTPAAARGTVERGCTAGAGCDDTPTTG